MEKTGTSPAGDRALLDARSTGCKTKGRRRESSLHLHHKRDLLRIGPDRAPWARVQAQRNGYCAHCVVQALLGRASVGVVRVNRPLESRRGVAFHYPAVVAHRAAQILRPQLAVLSSKQD